MQQPEITNRTTNILVCGPIALKVECVIYYNPGAPEGKRTGARYIIPTFRKREGFKAQHSCFTSWDYAWTSHIDEVERWLKSKGHKPEKMKKYITAGGKHTPEIAIRHLGQWIDMTGKM